MMRHQIKSSIFFRYKRVISVAILSSKKQRCNSVWNRNGLPVLIFMHLYIFLYDLFNHLKIPLSCLYSLLLPVMLTSSAPRRTCHSCLSLSPTSSWHKELNKRKTFVHTLLVMLSSVHTFWMFDCHDVLSLGDDPPPLIYQWNQTHFFISPAIWEWLAHMSQAFYILTPLYLSDLRVWSYLQLLHLFWMLTT